MTNTHTAKLYELYYVENLDVVEDGLMAFVLM
jgi:hypothetical protein